MNIGRTTRLQEKENKIFLQSEDEYKLKAVIEILEQKLVKRKVPLKGLVYGTVTPAGGNSVPFSRYCQPGEVREKSHTAARTPSGAVSPTATTSFVAAIALPKPSTPVKNSIAGSYSLTTMATRPRCTGASLRARLTAGELASG